MFQFARSGTLNPKTVEVKASFMHYLEAGEGKPVLFLHGNPTSSYLWRNVIPHVSSQARCIALDLIGMGASGKPVSDYRLVDHTAYVEAFIDALKLTDITLVLHDWGLAIGLRLLMHRPDSVKAVAFMEGHLHPVESWQSFDDGARDLFTNVRTEGTGERLILKENLFVEKVLPSGILRELSESEMAAYRAPYPDETSRKPILSWVREIPIEGQPADVREIVKGNLNYFAETKLPKLLLHVQPGALIGPDELSWCRDHLANLKIVNVGAGLHFLPEDQPEKIGTALSQWLSVAK